MKNIILLSLLILLCNSCFNKTKKRRQKGYQYTEVYGRIETEYGTMRFSLSDHAPKHKAKFYELAKEGYYDDFHFNRVIKDFVIQGGCPDSVQYFKDSPYLLDPEFHPSLRHRYGAIGMGRDDNPKMKSNACQLYIVTNKKGLPKLDDKYMIIGYLDYNLGDSSSFTTLEKIQNLKTDSTDTPLQRVDMTVRLDTIFVNRHN
jgi:peptidyl-prolyl cis-trans isomerase B (cyclophilin B)